MTDNKTTAQPAATPTPEIGIRIDDVHRLAQMVEIAFKRGAYSDIEVEAAKPAFDRTYGFLKTINDANIAAAKAAALNSNPAAVEVKTASQPVDVEVVPQAGAATSTTAKAPKAAKKPKGTV
jgi:hypothetical protein